MLCGLLLRAMSPPKAAHRSMDPCLRASRRSPCVTAGDARVRGYPAVLTEPGGEAGRPRCRWTGQRGMRWALGVPGDDSHCKNTE